MEEAESEGYKCIICGQSYGQEISLYAHITSHSREIMVTESDNNSGTKQNGRKLRGISLMNPNKENRSPGECWNNREHDSNRMEETPLNILCPKEESGCRVRYNGKQYQCETCLKMYKAKKGLLWHVRTMHNSVDFEYKCEVCGSIYALHEQLQHHFKVSHSSVQLDCDSYDKTVKKIHRKVSAKELKCTICGQSFQTRNELKTHINEHMKEQSYECDTCKECFTSKKVLLLHLLRTHLNKEEKSEESDGKSKIIEEKNKKKKVKQEKPYKCDVENCHYATTQVYLLKAHKFKHNPFYKCVTCQEKLPSRQELKIHMSTHGERPYKCDQCSKCYKDKHGLGWHKKVQHDPSRLKYTCELCGKTYPFDSLLTQHINLTHAAEKQSVCDICGKNVSKTYLPIHRRTHGEKQYSCDVCQKTFLEKAYLKRHKMIHTGEKPYVCSVCGNLFRQHSTLTIHMRTHTGDRPYKCVLCENAYKTHHNLKKHYRRSGHKMV